MGMEDATIKLHRTDSLWNFQFLADYFSAPPDTTFSNKKDTSRGIELDLKEVDLSHIHFLKKDEWRGEDMELRLNAMRLDADQISLTQKIARINTLSFTQPEFTLTNYNVRKPPLGNHTTEVYINDPLHLRLNPAGWDITAGKITIRNGCFRN